MFCQRKNDVYVNKCSRFCYNRFAVNYWLKMGMLIEKSAAKSESSNGVVCDNVGDKKGKIEAEGTDSQSEEYLAPDGGWGWMVAFGMIILSVTSCLLHYFDIE